MAITPVDLIAIGFGVFNVLKLVSYLSQILAVARDRHGAVTISVSCWAIWIGANVSTALYAWTHLGDLSLVAVSVLNAAGCSTVLTFGCLQVVHGSTPGEHPSHVRRLHSSQFCTCEVPGVSSIAVMRRRSVGE
jgi:hypothetical protein